MALEIRTITAEESSGYLRTLEMAFSETVAADEIERGLRVAELDRMHAAFEDGRIVGGASAASFEMTVAGGAAVRAGGVTGVGVLPTHRRRGVNTALMRAQLDDMRRRGDPVAVLWASEGGIYGRYGYGLASFMGEINVDAGRSMYLRGYAPAGRVELLGRDDALPLMRPVYEEACRNRAGMIRLDERWFAWRWAQLKRDEGTPSFHAIHRGDDGGVNAYAVYQVKHEWPDSIPRLELSVTELMATDPQAYADMWRFVFDIDLVRHVNAWNRPSDEPLLHLLAEPRQLRMTVKDALWIRLVDVPDALGARGYAGTGRAVIEVTDDFCPWNTGRYELEVRGGAAACSATGASPELACGVNELGAIYLGGTTLAQLQRAGRVRELVPGAIARADRLFASDPAPWCSFLF